MRPRTYLCDFVISTASAVATSSNLMVLYETERKPLLSPAQNEVSDVGVNSIQFRIKYVFGDAACSSVRAVGLVA